MQTTPNLSEISINYQPRLKHSELPKISSSAESVKHLRGIWSDRINYCEEAYLLLLNRANKVLGYCLLSTGGTSGTVVDIKVIYQTALKSNAHNLILAHNHPSGNTKPSEQDIRLTKEVKEAGKLLGIVLLDHIILTEEGYFSFSDEGQL